MALLFSSVKPFNYCCRTITLFHVLNVGHPPLKETVVRVSDCFVEKETQANASADVKPNLFQCLENHVC